MTQAALPFVASFTMVAIAVAVGVMQSRHGEGWCVVPPSDRPWPLQLPAPVGLPPAATALM